MNQYALIFNSGSTSLKMTAFGAMNKKLTAIATFNCQGINSSKGFINYKINSHKSTKQNIKLTFADALKFCFKILQDQQIITNLHNIIFCSHRFVHGVNLFNKPVVITPNIRKQLEEIKDFAPLHNPIANHIYDLLKKMLPETIPHIAGFDTAFHQQMPEEEYLYPIPKLLAQKYQLRKFGAHGINYDYVNDVLNELVPNGNFIVAHLGGGASMCVIKSSKSLATSMEFTPLSGLMMATRSGNIDPEVLGKLINHFDGNVKKGLEILTKESGIKAIAPQTDGLFNVLSDEIAKNSLSAKLAYKMFCTRLFEYLGSYVWKVDENVDVIVLTAGIGENAKILQHDFFKKLQKMFTLVQKLNTKTEKIHILGKFKNRHGKEFLFCIVPANEELQLYKYGVNLTKKHVATF